MRWLLAVTAAMVLLAAPAAAQESLASLLIDTPPAGFEPFSAEEGGLEGPLDLDEFVSVMDEDVADEFRDHYEEGLAHSWINQGESLVLIVLGIRFDEAVAGDDFTKGLREEAEKQGGEAESVPSIDGSVSVAMTQDGASARSVGFARDDHAFMVIAAGQDAAKAKALAEDMAVQQHGRLPAGLREKTDTAESGTPWWIFPVVGAVVAGVVAGVRALRNRRSEPKGVVMEHGDDPLAGIARPPVAGEGDETAPDRPVL